MESFLILNTPFKLIIDILKKLLIMVSMISSYLSSLGVLQGTTSNAYMITMNLISFSIHLPTTSNLNSAGALFHCFNLKYHF